MRGSLFNGWVTAHTCVCSLQELLLKDHIEHIIDPHGDSVPCCSGCYDEDRESQQNTGRTPPDVPFSF